VGFIKGMEMQKYRNLKKGEITRDGDEKDACADPWKDRPRWEKCEAGIVVPDPAYPAHTRYRRPLESSDTELNRLNEDEYLSRDIGGETDCRNYPN
jgi:hypothetical protein